MRCGVEARPVRSAGSDCCGRGGFTGRRRDLRRRGDLGFFSRGAGASAGGGAAPRLAARFPATGDFGLGGSSGGVASLRLQRRELARARAGSRRWPRARPAARSPGYSLRCRLSAAPASGSTPQQIARTGRARRSLRLPRGIVLLREHRFRRRRRAACWQIPHGQRAAAPRRRARTPGSTSTARSRRTENESREAWTRVPPSQSAAKVFGAIGNAVTTELAGSRRAPPPARANQADFEDSATLPGVCYKIGGIDAPAPAAFSRSGAASLPRPVADHHNMPESGRISRICLECAAIFRHLPLTVRCRLGDYTRAMMIKRILTICAAVAAGAAGTSLGAVR